MRHSVANRDLLKAARQSDDPIRALWRFLMDKSRIAIALEFMAMANHRKVVRTHMAEHVEAMRAARVVICPPSAPMAQI